MPVGWLNQDYLEFVISFTVVHQGVIEFYKLASGYKVRRYWEALPQRCRLIRVRRQWIGR